MDWRMDTWGMLMWVSPFRHLRVNGYLLLTAAFRSLSRLSSALSAKASTLRSFLLYLRFPFTIALATRAPAVFTASLCFRKIEILFVACCISRMSWYLWSFYCFKQQNIRYQYLSLYEVFKVHTTENNNFTVPVMEMVRFELMTPCLQGRCSPNWATPPFGILKLFCFNLAATCFPIPSPV